LPTARQIISCSTPQQNQNKGAKNMTGLYYAILAVAAAAIYVFSIVLKVKNKAGCAACYAILFLLVLLFI